MAEERESELLWPSNNKEGGRKREKKKKTENETVEENWPVTAIRDIVSLSSLSPLLSSLVSWRAAVSKSHPTIYPFPSPSFQGAKDVSWVPFVSPTERFLIPNPIRGLGLHRFIGLLQRCMQGKIWCRVLDAVPNSYVKPLEGFIWT